MSKKDNLLGIDLGYGGINWKRKHIPSKDALPEVDEEIVINLINYDFDVQQFIKEFPIEERK